jgi:hypothetical protein
MYIKLNRDLFDNSGSIDVLTVTRDREESVYHFFISVIPCNKARGNITICTWVEM